MKNNLAAGPLDFFSELLRQFGNKEKKPFKMRTFHLDHHKKSTKCVVQVFLAKKKFYHLNFFLDQLFFQKIVMTLILKRKISHKKHKPEGQ